MNPELLAQLKDGAGRNALLVLGTICISTGSTLIGVKESLMGFLFFVLAAACIAASMFLQAKKNCKVHKKIEKVEKKVNAMKEDEPMAG